MTSKLVRWLAGWEDFTSALHEQACEPLSELFTPLSGTGHSRSSPLEDPAFGLKAPEGIQGMVWPDYVRDRVHRLLGGVGCSRDWDGVYQLSVPTDLPLGIPSRPVCLQAGKADWFRKQPAFQRALALGQSISFPTSSCISCCSQLISPTRLL